MQDEVMVCTACGFEWLVQQSYLCYPHARWCSQCRRIKGRIAESLRTEDTRPGPAADLFEEVMLSKMMSRSVPSAEEALRAALGVGPYFAVEGHRRQA